MMRPDYALRKATSADLETIVGFTLEEARAAGAVDLRLYAHGSNQRALEAYRRCGFDETPYVIMRRRLADD